MKTATKTSKMVHTPETVTGSCMSGKLMTKEQAKKMEQWVLSQKAKQPKTFLQKIFS